VCTTSENAGNRLEFEIASGKTGNLLEFEGKTGNLLEFNCCSWKFLYNKSMIDDYLATIQLLGNWLAQFVKFLANRLYTVVQKKRANFGGL